MMISDRSHPGPTSSKQTWSKRTYVTFHLHRIGPPRHRQLNRSLMALCPLQMSVRCLKHSQAPRRRWTEWTYLTLGPIRPERMGSSSSRPNLERRGPPTTADGPLWRGRDWEVSGDTNRHRSVWSEGIQTYPGQSSIHWGCSLLGRRKDHPCHRWSLFTLKRGGQGRDKEKAPGVLAGSTLPNYRRVFHAFKIFPRHCLAISVLVLKIPPMPAKAIPSGG